jgi:hypothetical protein
MTKARDTAGSMSLERFEALVDAYGAQSDRWPDEERSSALALLSDSAPAQQALHGATALDDLLDNLLDDAPVEEPSAALRRQILAAAPERQPTWLERLDRLSEQLWPFTPRWQPATGLAAAAAFGIVVGPMVPDTAAASEPVDVAELAFGGDAEWDSNLESELP